MQLGELELSALGVLRLHGGRWQRSGDLVREIQGRNPTYPKKITRAFDKLRDEGLAESRGEHGNREWRATSARPVNKDALRPSVDLSIALLKLRQLAQTHVPTSVIGELEDYFDSAARLLERNTVASRITSARAWVGKTTRIDVGYPLIPPKVGGQMLDDVLRALYADVCLTVTYRNAQKASTEANRFDVLPLALVERGPVLYLVADRPRGTNPPKRYLLRLDRIEAVAACNAGLRRDPTFDLDEYVKTEKMLQFYPESPCEIVLRVREDGKIHGPFREQRLTLDQEIVEEEGGFTLKATVSPSLALKNLLFERADMVEVLSPRELRDEIRARLRQALSIYESDA